MVSEHLPGPPAEFAGLTEAEQERVIAQAQRNIDNAFERWLRIKGEVLNRNLDSIETEAGIFERFVLGEDG